MTKDTRAWSKRPPNIAGLSSQQRQSASALESLAAVKAENERLKLELENLEMKARILEMKARTQQLEAANQPPVPQVQPPLQQSPHSSLTNSQNQQALLQTVLTLLTQMGVQMPSDASPRTQEGSMSQASFATDTTDTSTNPGSVSVQCHQDSDLSQSTASDESTILQTQASSPHETPTQLDSTPRKSNKESQQSKRKARFGMENVDEEPEAPEETSWPTFDANEAEVLRITHHAATSVESRIKSPPAKKTRDAARGTMNVDLDQSGYSSSSAAHVKSAKALFQAADSTTPGQDHQAGSAGSEESGGSA